MPTAPAKTADEIAENIRSMVDEIARRGQELGEFLAERGGEVGERVEDAWKETADARRDAAKSVSRASRDAAKWSSHTWRKELLPSLRDLWKRRTVAMTAAGAAVPAGKELVDEAAVRLGLRRREERHWGAFFIGLLIGAAAGAVIALLAAPKPGSDMRREIASRARDAARDADWAPLFQRETETSLGSNGSGNETATEASGSATGDASGAPKRTSGASSSPRRTPRRSVSEPPSSVQEGAAESGVAGGATAAPDVAADQTAEAINESFEPADTTEREGRQ